MLNLTFRVSQSYLSLFDFGKNAKVINLLDVINKSIFEKKLKTYQ